MALQDDRDIARAAREAGVVGAGGAGFPTHVKLAAAGVDTVIANGAECEPLLANDQAVMIHRTGDLLQGLELAAQAVGARRRVIAVKAKRGGIISHLQARAGAQAIGAPRPDRAYHRALTAPRAPVLSG